MSNYSPFAYVIKLFIMGFNYKFFQKNTKNADVSIFPSRIDPKLLKFPFLIEIMDPND